MRVRVRKWGNSLAVRIPKPFAEDVAVREGTILDLSVTDGKLVAAPLGERRFTLKQLLKSVSGDNLHSEIEFGAPVGREAL